MKEGDIVKTLSGDKREILKIIVSDDKTIVVSVSV